MNSRPWVRRPVEMIDPSGNVVETYQSVEAAAKDGFMSFQSIRFRCNGKIKKPFELTGYSYRWAEESQEEIKISSKVERVDPVSGEVVEVYGSPWEAGRKLGMSPYGITNHCDGKIKRLTARDGYIYRWADQERKNRERVGGRGKKVAKYDSSGKIVAVYESIREAADANHRHLAFISERCRGHFKSYVGKDGYGYCFWDGLDARKKERGSLTWS